MNQVLVRADVFERLQQAMASDPQGLCELYRDYLSDAWQTLAALRAACEQGQSGEFGSKAHYLKSSSLVLGIQPVAQYCTQMEEIGRSADLQQAPRKLEETGELLYKVQSELETRLGPEVIPSTA